MKPGKILRSLFGPALRLVPVLGLLALPACQEQEPVRIGFVGGLTGKVADLGVAGRNGAQLAVEQRNAAGGIKGRSIELVVRDDEQQPESAQRVIRELIGLNLELIIGPMTSSMAMAMLPQINSSRSILLSPTVTATALAGKDDNFLRAISTTADYASKSARYQYHKLGTRSVAVVYDTGNQAYSESWLNDFRATFTTLGGRVLLVKGFHSGPDNVFQPLVRELLAAKADAVLIISNAVDSALICQQVRALAPHQRIIMSEWASTERFLEMAGPAAEGLVVAQFLDRGDRSQRYLDFRRAYLTRFKQEPGFAGLAGYDSAMIALEAYSARKKGESLKSAIISRRTFQGVQQPLQVDRYGDADRKTFVTVIRGNRYLTLE